MDYGSGCIARWTAAPELPGAERFAADCLANGILPSIGHTDATIRDVRRAMEAGFRHVTHLYSDMSTVTRESGFRVPACWSAHSCSTSCGWRSSRTAAICRRI